MFTDFDERFEKRRKEMETTFAKRQRSMFAVAIVGWLFSLACVGGVIAALIWFAFWCLNHYGVI